VFTRGVAGVRRSLRVFEVVRVRPSGGEVWKRRGGERGGMGAFYRHGGASIEAGDHQIKATRGRRAQHSSARSPRGDGGGG
jgi:hypothetical protein